MREQIRHERPERNERATVTSDDVSGVPSSPRLYVWADGDPGVTPPDLSIPDAPGVNDNDQIADAIVRGDLGRYLPVTLHFADHPTPTPKRVRAIDTARLLRDHNIRHRRRYEIIQTGAGAERTPGR